MASILAQHKDKMYLFKLNGKQYLGYAKRYDKALNQLVWRCSAPFTDEQPTEVLINMDMAFSPPEMFDSAEIIKVWLKPSGKHEIDTEGNEWIESYPSYAESLYQDNPTIYINE